MEAQVYGRIKSEIDQKYKNFIIDVAKPME